mgnify:CR=1 FL=1
MTTHVSGAEAETRQIAAAFAATLKAGDVVLLAGDLGAGKTAFVRGLADGLGVDPDEVTSPTFTLVHEYRGGRLPLIHIDLYRLERADLDDLKRVNDTQGHAAGDAYLREFARALTAGMRQTRGDAEGDVGPTDRSWGPWAEAHFRTPFAGLSLICLVGAVLMAGLPGKADR